MDNRIMLFLLIAAHLFRAGMLHAAPVENDFQTLCEAYGKARAFTSPRSKDGLQWLEGRWECVDRIWRGPRAVDVSYYAFLREIQIDRNDIFPSRTVEGEFDLSIKCSFIRDAAGYKGSYKRMDRYVLTVLNDEGFWFGIPSPDVLVMKTDPAKVPQWFIWEHTKANDILLFKRVKEEPEEAKGTSGKKMVTPGASKDRVSPK